jgi:hypothetical protein
VIRALSQGSLLAFTRQTRGSPGATCSTSRGGSRVRTRRIARSLETWKEASLDGHGSSSPRRSEPSRMEMTAVRVDRHVLHAHRARLPPSGRWSSFGEFVTPYWRIGHRHGSPCEGSCSRHVGSSCSPCGVHLLPKWGPQFAMVKLWFGMDSLHVHRGHVGRVPGEPTRSSPYDVVGA